MSDLERTGRKLWPLGDRLCLRLTIRLSLTPAASGPGTRTEEPGDLDIQNDAFDPEWNHTIRPAVSRQPKRLIW
jgi:hypothetical protein